jgi:membrane associated rhomboid family serine protease
VNSHFFGGPATKVVKNLIIINIAVFFVQIIFRVFGSRDFDAYLGLVPAFVTHNNAYWQLVTYMFLHSTEPPFFHILFNMLTLFMFGNELARLWGTVRFLTYYFVTGIGAGICSWIVTLMVEKNETTIIVGASGAIYGLLLAYGMTYPNRTVYLNFLLPLKVKWLVFILGVVAFLSSIVGGDSNIANIAHLGGMVIGYVYLNGLDWSDKYRLFLAKRRREQLKRQFEVYYGDVRRKVEQDKGKGPTIH